MRLPCLILATLLLASTAPAGADGAPTDSPEPMPVFVSILPQIGFVEEIGGDRVDPHVLVEPGQSPHAFEPTPRQVAALSESRAWFTIGLPFESHLLDRIRSIRPELDIVDTSAGVPRRVMARWRGDKEDRSGGEHAGHGHGEGGAAEDHAGHEHSEHGAPDPHAGHGHGEHGLTDPHTWLDPERAALQAASIAAGLSEVDPDHAALYSANLDRAVDRLNRLDAEVSELLRPFEGRRFYVFHPAFGYFADAYGLKQVAVQVEGKEPSARDLAALVDRARAENVRVIFVQPQFSTKTAEALAREIDGEVVPIDPLARDYHANVTAMAEAIAAALGGEGAIEEKTP